MSTQKHPCQRLPSPAPNGVSAAIHVRYIPLSCPTSTFTCIADRQSQLFGLASFAYSFKFLLDFPTPINASYGWHFQYLTIIGLALATATFLAGLAADVSTSPVLHRLKNYLSMCTAPLEVLISVLYWSLRTIDRKLVIPEWAMLPLRADLGFHAVPSILLVADLLLLSPPWTISATRAMGLSTALAFAYWFWIEHCFSHNGFYPYPIFEMVDTKGRIGLFTTSALVMTGSTVALKWLYAKVNGVGDARASGERSGKAQDESSMSEAVNGYMRQGTYMAKGQVETL